jgi:hypothetical protein
MRGLKETKERKWSPSPRVVKVETERKFWERAVDCREGGCQSYILVNIHTQFYTNPRRTSTREHQAQRCSKLPIWLGVRCLVRVMENSHPQTFGKGAANLVNENMFTHYCWSLSLILHVIWALWSKVNDYLWQNVSSQFSSSLIWE